jgi:hypothetical protein
MNPIEHVWDFIGRKINQRNPKCQNIDELRTAILQEWQQFPLSLMEVFNIALKCSLQFEELLNASIVRICKAYKSITSISIAFIVKFCNTHRHASHKTPKPFLGELLPLL